MNGYRTCFKVFSIYLAVFDLLIAGFSIFVSSFLWAIGLHDLEDGQGKFLFLGLLIYSVFHAFGSLVLTFRGRSDEKLCTTKHRNWSVVLQVCGICVPWLFYCLYMTFIPKFFGGYYNEDFTVVLPIVIVYFGFSVFNLIMVFFASAHDKKQDYIS